MERFENLGFIKVNDCKWTKEGNQSIYKDDFGDYKINSKYHFETTNDINKVAAIYNKLAELDRINEEC